MIGACSVHPTLFTAHPQQQTIGKHQKIKKNEKVTVNSKNHRFIYYGAKNYGNTLKEEKKKSEDRMGATPHKWRERERPTGGGI